MGSIVGDLDRRPSVLPQLIPQPGDDRVMKQSVVVEGTGDWGSGVHRSTLGVDGLVGLVDPYVCTLYDNFRHGAARSDNGPCLGYREVVDGVAGPFRFYTYREIAVMAGEVGSAIRYLGLERGDFVGIYSKNCVEWVVVEQACNAFTHATVAIYDTFGAEAVQHIINHSEQKIVFVDKPKLDQLYNAIAGGTPGLKHAVCFGDVSENDVTKFSSHGVTLLKLDQARQLGREHPLDHDPPKSSDTAILMYTSGTTGNPKGVIITHFNMVSAVNAAAKAVPLFSWDCYLSFLPLAHSYERLNQVSILQAGGSIGFWQGDVPKLPDDFKALQPTIVVGVPRVFNRFYEKVRQTIESGGFITRRLYQRAYAFRKAALELGQDTPWYNYLLFDRLKAALGGRVRYIISGSAPLDAKVHEWLRVCLCPMVLQGYGLTETCASVTVQLLNDMSVGTIGTPLPANELKLADVPEMDYYTKDDPPCGELLIRGNGVFQYYYKDPEKTKEDKDEDGWFHTGDIGCWNKDGSLSIIDRKKNIFKLAQGEYIAVELLEGVYERCPYVGQVYVYGDSLKPFLLAVVVPDKEQTMAWAARESIEGDFDAVCKHPKTREMLEMEIAKQGKSAKLRGFELVKGIVVHSEPFSIENNLMTPTFKLKRPVAVKVFREKFNALYEEIEGKMK